MISAIVFDLDGTLIDSKEDIIGSANFALKTIGKAPVTVSEGIKHVGRGAHYLLEKLLPGESPAVIQKCHSLFLDYYAQNPVLKTKVYKGVFEVLSFYEKLPMFVVTNKNENVANLILQKLLISKYFKQVVGGDTYDQLKPNPYAIEKIIENYAVKRPQMLMVGDTDIDIQFGINANIKTCRFESNFGAMSDCRLAKENIKIKHFLELKSVINSL